MSASARCPSTSTGSRFSSSATRWTSPFTSMSLVCGLGSRASCAYERRKRPRDPERVSIRFRPSWISSARGRSGTRDSMRLMLCAMDLIGVSELLISCDSTRTIRCQASCSCSRSARLRSAKTSSWCGLPSRLKVAAAQFEPSGLGTEWPIQQSRRFPFETRCSFKSPARVRAISLRSVPSAVRRRD